LSFVCAECNHNSLKIMFAFELPPTPDDDEIALQLLSCGDCNFQGLAVYRESRHGSLDSESWQHLGYVLSEKSMSRLMRAMLDCPLPVDRDCQCEAHAELKSYDWSVVAKNGVEVVRQFEMRLVP
jgi:hypothetical protein